MADHGRPFTVGHSKLGGRSKGTLNRSTVEVRELAQRLVTDPDYIASLERRLKRGKLSPAMEALLWAYAFGRPREYPPSGDVPVTFTLAIPESPSVSPLRLRAAALFGTAADAD